MKSRKKFSKLSIISFILALIGILLAITNYLNLLFIDSFNSFESFTPLLIVSIISSITAAIISIISFKIIERNELKGKSLSKYSIAISSISFFIDLIYTILPSLIFIYALLMISFAPCKTTYLYSPIEFEISATNLEITPLENYSGNPDINIYIDNQSEQMPPECYPDNYYFRISEAEFWKDEIKENPSKIPKNPGKEEEMGVVSYSKPGKITYNHFDGMERGIKKLLEKGRADIKIRYKLDPIRPREGECKQWSRDSQFDRISINGERGVKDVSTSEIICLKTEDSSCKYFNVSSRIKIKYDVDLDNTIEEKYTIGSSECNPF